MRSITKALIAFSTLTVVFILFGIFIVYWLPNHTNLNSNGDPAIYRISIQTVPSIINGVTTATGIIVGFSATVLGIVTREFLKKNERDKRIRNTLIGTILFIFPVILLLDFGAYIFLLVGGEMAFKLALNFVLNGFLGALLDLIGIFIIIALITEERKVAI